MKPEPHNVLLILLCALTGSVEVVRISLRWVEPVRNGRLLLHRYEASPGAPDKLQCGSWRAASSAVDADAFSSSVIPVPVSGPAGCGVQVRPAGGAVQLYDQSNWRKSSTQITEAGTQTRTEVRSHQVKTLDQIFKRL